MHGCKHIRGMAENAEGIRFQRMFPDLPPAYTDPAKLKALGRPDGPMHEADPDGNASRTERVPAGHVFLGQFIDHDITLDLTSSLDATNDPDATENFRTPALDLDCVYGDGPEGSPFLYEEGGDFGSVKLYVPEDGIDLPRAPNHRALIGDPRNDENRIVSQIQLAFIKFHNAVVDRLADEYSGHELFEAAREQVRWHYHWIILHEFLPAMIGIDATRDILNNGRRFYFPADRPFIPIEFAVAGYRFGHSMVPEQIILKDPDSPVMLLTIGAFRPVENADDAVNLSFYFGVDTTKVFARKLDTKMAPTLLDLFFMRETQPDADLRSLATRNLLRGQAFGLPSGQSIAERMADELDGVPVLSGDDVPLDGDLAELRSATPLWYYLLLEAERFGFVIDRDGEQSPGGQRLGPVGGRIVGETLIGIMETDPTSLLGAERNWQPTLFNANGRFEMSDLVSIVGMDR